MVVIYGAARLLIATLDPYRRTVDMYNRPKLSAMIASAATWVIAVGAVIGLVVLGADVAGSSASLGNLGG